MAGYSTPDMSIDLYDYLCHNFVGSEDYVRLIRLINSSKDRCYRSKSGFHITSGSFGEGLELKGSDLDIMRVTNELEVTEQMKLKDFHSDKNYFIADTDNVKPGFAYLRLMTGNTIHKHFLYRSVEGQLFLSSALLKQCCINENLSVVHGPCVSDKEGNFDIAFTIHSKSWITTASKWVTRLNYSWPTSKVKQRVIDHGVLFVPIGTRENLNEELKWRISFSVGEKFLIYSFTHTQLLCYALMKILLKDVISESPGCKNLLCSYHIKTILFWLSEELPTSMWKKDNMIPCFMKCVKRLVYCVEYSMCPHYFIPENNLFENKIIGHGRTKLLETLYMLIDYGWRCIFISPQISIMSLSFGAQLNVDLFFNDIVKIVKSKALVSGQPTGNVDYVRALQLVLSSQTKKLRSIHKLNVAQTCYLTAQTMQLSGLLGNKYKYKQYKQCLCYILQSTHHDAVAGWLMLASLFYTMKQYNQALYVVSYSLRKCTIDKLYHGAYVSDLHREHFRFTTFKKLGMIRMLRIQFLYFVVFPSKSSFIPCELDAHNMNNMPYVLPPVAYLHFLRFLCHYHLNNIKNCQESLRDLRLKTKEDYFNTELVTKAVAYDCLGVAFQIIGAKESAREAFKRSIELFPDMILNRSYKRLSMMDQV